MTTKKVLPTLQDYHRAVEVEAQRLSINPPLSVPLKLNVKGSGPKRAKKTKAQAKAAECREDRQLDDILAVYDRIEACIAKKSPMTRRKYQAQLISIYNPCTSLERCFNCAELGALFQAFDALEKELSAYKDCREIKEEETPEPSLQWKNVPVATKGLSFEQELALIKKKERAEMEELGQRFTKNLIPLKLAGTMREVEVATEVSVECKNCGRVWELAH
jgi:hypothetical protein